MGHNLLDYRIWPVTQDLHRYRVIFAGRMRAKHYAGIVWLLRGHVSRSTGATRCTDVGEIWRGGFDQILKILRM